MAWTWPFRRETRALTYDELSWMAVPATAAGISVSPDAALRSPTLLAAVRVISESVGTLPVHVFRRGPDGSRQRDTAHPASALLAIDANPWTGAADLRVHLQRDALLHGFGIAKVVAAGGAPRELHRLPADAVTAELDDLTGEPRYRYRLRRGGEEVLSWRDVLVVTTPGSTADRPLRLVDLVREAVAVDIAMARYQAKLFGGAARPSGVLRVPKGTPPERLKLIRSAWQQAHAGDNSGGTAIVEDGTEWQQISLSLVDAQFLELRRFVVADIARAFKVPLTLVGDFDRAVWKNVEELLRQFLQTCLLPWLDVWQGSLERALFTPEERKTYFVEFILDDLVRADLAARFTAYRNAVGGAWMTANEIRARDNLPPIAGGDELLRQAGQATADAAGDMPGMAPSPAAAPPDGAPA